MNWLTIFRVSKLLKRYSYGLNQLDWKLVITVYAAIVSTFVAVWRIYEFIDDRKGRIRIIIISGTDDPIIKFWDEDDKEHKIVALITNVGKKARYIKIPYFNVWPRMVIMEHIEMSINISKGAKPTQLIPGEEFQYEIPMWLLVKYRKAGAKKMQVQLTDTHKKLYKSKWREL